MSNRIGPTFWNELAAAGVSPDGFSVDTVSGELTISAPLDEATVARIKAVIAAHDPDATPPVPVPAVTARQLRLWLVRNGVPLASVDAAIAALPDPQRTEAQIEWQYASDYQCANPLLAEIGAAIGKTPAEIDAGMREAALI